MNEKNVFGQMILGEVLLFISHTSIHAKIECFLIMYLKHKKVDSIDVSDIMLHLQKTHCITIDLVFRIYFDKLLDYQISYINSSSR